jgi:hypothetical protein
MNSPKPRPGYVVPEKSVNSSRLGGGLVRNDRALRAGGIDAFLVFHSIDIVWLFLLSLLLCVLVRIVFWVAVITIMPYCPLMS